MWQADTMYPIERRPLICLLCIMLWSMICASSAQAWGFQGHQITGLIAESLLTDTAKRQVEQLLGKESLAAATTYMDKQRSALSKRWHLSSHWHYDNQALCKFQPYCLDGNCATYQIERFTSVLADRKASTSDRAMALRLLIHMLGDIHQPLHTSDNNDRGGNSVKVRLEAGKRQYSLHEVMDTALIKQLVGSQRLDAYATKLKISYNSQFSRWQVGSPKEWAAQSYALANQQVYRQLPEFACGIAPKAPLTLSAPYLRAAKTYLPEQIAKAGVRMAYILNSTLK